MERAARRLRLILPLTGFIILLLLYIHFQNLIEVAIVMVSVVLFAPVGGVWLMYALDYNMSVAVWVGFIALAGLAAETGIVMLAYLDEVYERRKREGRLRTITELYDAIIEGAVLRVRPKLMTVVTTLVALMPVMIGNVFESGSQIMQRIAAPMVGGLISATVLTLVIIPAIYMVWRRWAVSREIRQNRNASPK
jgi:Cu(I)/Ag(I) efflux system membrane protein CusA/SilA